MNDGPARRGAGSAPVIGYLALHLLLALLWTTLVGWDGPRFLVGLAVGWFALAAAARSIGSGAYLRALRAAAVLFAHFLFDLVLANLHLARDILRRRRRFSPAILALDVSDLGSVHTGLLVSLVSLTPGSICIDLDRSERTIFVHALYARDEREALHRIHRYTALLRVMAGAAPVRREGP